MSSGAIALVLGSGGARAAYEVGVARYLFEELHRPLARTPGARIFCGTSAGALNALGLACFAGQPLSGVAFLAHRWRDLRLGDVIRPRGLELLRLGRALAGCPSSWLGSRAGAGSLLDPRPLRRRILDCLPVADLTDQFRLGHLEGVSFSATEVATGRTVVFQQRRGSPPAPVHPAAGQIVETRLTVQHALASAAIPLLFPPVRIGGRAYCDGALRQSVPLSPALRLGAERVVVVSTQHLPPRTAPRLEHEREQAVTNPLYLLGKAVNALTLDRIDDDLERLTGVNQLLQAGERVFGSNFLAQLNVELARSSLGPVRPIGAVLVRPSESLGGLACEYLRSRTFRSRAGAIGGLFRRLAAAESEHEVDLLSYLLFDGPFLNMLMDLGHADARAQHGELVSLLERDPAAARAA